MSCWHAHGPWCHGGYGYPYPPPYPPPDYYPSPEFRPSRRSRRARDADDLADYLRDLEEEIAQVRRDLEELRGTGSADT